MLAAVVALLCPCLPNWERRLSPRSFITSISTNGSKLTTIAVFSQTTICSDFNFAENVEQPGHANRLMDHMIAAKVPVSGLPTTRPRIVGYNHKECVPPKN
jgi:hypothetical protein